MNLSSGRLFILLDLFDFGLILKCGTGFQNLRSDASFIFLEIFNKQFRQFPRFLVVVIGPLPSVALIENPIRNIRTMFWNMQTKNRIRFRCNLVQPPIQDRIDHRSGMSDRHTFTNTVRAARPTGINQPAIDAMFINAFP